MKCISAIIKKYNGMNLKRQIVAILCIFCFIPVSAVFVLIYRSDESRIIEEQKNFAVEDLEVRTNNLNMYMRQYMKPFYKVIIDKELWKILSAPQNENNFSYQIFSILSEYSVPDNRNLKEYFLIVPDGTGYWLSFKTDSRVIISCAEEEFQWIYDLAEKAKKSNALETMLKKDKSNDIVMARSITDFNQNKRFLGTLVMVMGFDELDNIIAPRQAVQYRGTTLSVSDEERVLTQYFPEYTTSEQVTVSSDVLYTDWIITNTIDTGMICRTVRKKMILTMSIGLLEFGIAFVLVYMLIQKKLHILTRLEDAMSDVANRHRYEKIPSDSSNDFTSLFAGYNAMIVKIGDYQEKVRQQTEATIAALEAKREAEIKALELEINPHFLYNTLNSINSIAIENNDLETSNQIKRFSFMLRYMVDNRMKMVTVEEEMNWLSTYLTLQRSRYDNSFDFEIDMDDEIRQCKIHKLLMQPFVENSILHGFCNLPRRGLLTIVVENNGNFVHVTIADNGHGMDEEQLRKLIRHSKHESAQQHLGLGVSNTCYRLQLYYGEDFDIRFESQKGIGTQISFWIPKIFHEKGNNNENCSS